MLCFLEFYEEFIFFIFYLPDISNWTGKDDDDDNNNNK